MLKKIFIILCSIIILIGLFWIISKRFDAYNFEKASTSCDTITVINEEIILYFKDFKHDDIEKINLRIRREGKFVKDTTLLNNVSCNSVESSYCSFYLNQTKIYRKDTIYLTTANQKTYTINGFDYFVSEHYGMFGSLGDYYCNFFEEFIINGKRTNQIINK